MAVLAALLGKLRFDSGTARDQIIVDAHVVSDPAKLLLDVDILTEVSGQLVPVVGALPIDDDGHFAGPVQTIYHNFSFLESLPGANDGVLMLTEDMVAWSCERSLEDGTEWSITLPGKYNSWDTYSYLVGYATENQDFGGSRIGYELDWKAPPMGDRECKMSGGYLTSGGGLAGITLFTRGISSDSTRTVSSSGHIQTINGLGAEGHYDSIQVCMVLPEGHGMTHGEVIRELASLAGVEYIGVGNGEGYKLYKPIEIINEVWWDTAKEIAEAINKIPYFTRTGQLVLRDYSSVLSDRNVRTQFVFNSEMIAAASGVTTAVSADIPTCVRAKADRIVFSDDACGIETRTSISETLTNYSAPQALFKQDSVGTISPYTSPTGFPTLQVTRRETVIKELWAGCTKKETIIVEGWYNPEVYRYKIDGTGAISHYNAYGWLFNSSVVKDDESPMYLWSTWRFVEISRQVTEYKYSLDTNECGSESTWPVGRHGLIASFTGQWFKPVTALKQWSQAPAGAESWDDVPYITPVANPLRVYADGSGAGRLGSDERYMYRDESNGQSALYNSQPNEKWGGSYVDPSPNGTLGGGWSYLSSGWFSASYTSPIADSECTTFRVAEATNSCTWQVLPVADGRYWYKDGTQSAYDGPVLATYGDRTFYIPTGEGSHIKQETNHSPGFKLNSESYSQEDGYLPAMDACEAQSEDRQEIEDYVCALTTTHSHKEITVSNEFIENEDSLRAFAIRILRESSAVVCNFQTVANFVLEPGMKIHIAVPDGRINHDAFIDAVRWYRDGDSMMCDVTAKIYVT